MQDTRQRLEDGTLGADEASATLAGLADAAPTLAARLEACRLLGEIAGRAFGASWDSAERAALLLLEQARQADSPRERAGLLAAMGRGFRNSWLLPYVHSRLWDEDEDVIAAAIGAAGGLAFPALEETIASFLSSETREPLRLAAIAALGRMGAQSAALRLVPFVSGPPEHAAAALAALTEVRAREGQAAALELIAREPPREVLLAAMRYLAEIGCEEVLRTLRRLARDEDAGARIEAGLASRALKAERNRDPAERILAAITEQDRAVRTALARRLRTLEVTHVLEQAELLLGEDAGGIIQIVAEVRAPEVTRFLLRLAGDQALEPAARARAAGSIEANEPWERDALTDLISAEGDGAVRIAAARTLGAFATPGLVLSRLEALARDPSPAVRAALLWALQASARPATLQGEDRQHAHQTLRVALADPDPFVRRRAAYVAGNLRATELAPELIALAKKETDAPDLRVAALVGLFEIGAADRIADLVFLWNREDDPDALAAASRAIESAIAEGAPPDALERARDRIRKLLGAARSEPRVLAAAARMAGLSGDAIAITALGKLVDHASPRVREQVVSALGRLRRPECERLLEHSLADSDPAIEERAAEALLGLGTASALRHVLGFVAQSADRAAALRIARRIELPEGGAELMDALRATAERAGPDDAVFELLLALEVEALQSTRPSLPTGADVDATIASLFPTWSRLSLVRGFAPLGKSLRTAEMLYTMGAGEGGDHSAAIVLWMKSLEGYLHAWLAPRLRTLQEQPSALWDLTSRLAGAAWPPYQRYLSERWHDPVKMGALSVELPLRSVVNALRELSERRTKSLDSPMSVTEWSRLMLFLALDHPTGPRNVLKVSCRDPERAIRLAHSLGVLAQVRNAVTHRQLAGSATLDEFRSAYYAAFEELTAMA